MSTLRRSIPPKGANAAYDRLIATLKEDMRDRAYFEERARDLVDRLAVGLQGATLVKHAPSFVSDAFCASRIEAQGVHQYGALRRGIDFPPSLSVHGRDNLHHMIASALGRYCSQSRLPLPWVWRAFQLRTR